MSWAEAHTRSERLAEAAHVALRNSEAWTAKGLFAQAAAAETEALAALGEDKP
jgi:hypothetical protein